MDNVYKRDDGWYFGTEDGGEIGPFVDSATAQERFADYCAEFIDPQPQRPEP